MSLTSRLEKNLVLADPPITTDRLGRPIIGPCLLWTGATQEGYGVIWDNEVKNNRKVHRVAYQLATGAPADGVLDHLCRVRNCAAVDHLEDVTNPENISRGDVALPNKMKTHCKHGHPYDEANTYYRKDHPGRHCRTCDRNRHRLDPADDAPPRGERTHCKNGHEWSDDNTYWVRRSAADATLRKQCRACKRERTSRSR